MRCAPWVLPALLFAFPSMTLAFESPTLVLKPYGQRMSDRYTSRDGLPGARVLSIELAGDEVRVRTDAGAALFSAGKWKSGGAGERESGRAGERFPFVDARKLPKGAKVLSAAKGKDGRVWVVTPDGMLRSQGDRYVPFGPPSSYLTEQQPVDIDAQFSCVLVDPNGTVWIGSDVGIFGTNGANWWNVFDRRNGLPYERITCLAFGPDGTLWAGTEEGVCRYVSGAWQYYWGPRWLPHNRVNDIAPDKDGGAWVATEGGVAHLYDRPLTLAEKAAHYQEITDTRHNRRGFVTGGRLRKPGDPTGGAVYEASDNDGLWTAVYVAAQSFRYAATKDPQAREAAHRSMRAMLDLVRYSGVPGFPARAIVTKEELKRGEADGYNAEETVRIPGETDKIWYQSLVDAQVLCKGDTSSDELDGHYFAWNIFYDLAADEEDRKAVRQTVEAVTDNLLRNDLTLVGPTGRKTRWGVYHPRYINDDPTWWEERGLNSLSILSYLTIADHICGHARYLEKRRELIEKHHYLLNTVTQKVPEPWWSVNHSDDQMAFMMYYSFLRLEKDPAVRLVLLQSLERSWKIERPEASPFFNFVYGASTGRPCDVEASVTTLQDWPWELIEWETRGTHRHDVTLLTHNGETRSRGQTTRALPASERRLMRWNGNPYEPDGGSPDGRNEEDGSAWLLPYWMGRYYKFIQE